MKHKSRLGAEVSLIIITCDKANTLAFSLPNYIIIQKDYYENYVLSIDVLHHPQNLGPQGFIE